MSSSLLYSEPCKKVLITSPHLFLHMYVQLFDRIGNVPLCLITFFPLGSSGMTSRLRRLVRAFTGRKYGRCQNFVARPICLSGISGFQENTKPNRILTKMQFYAKINCTMNLYWSLYRILCNFREQAPRL